ncbi:MAG: carbamoyltransferase HypF [Bradyrhizobium sp.]|nr:carbamoyltransferase HypF [Bradyrhizobium sp.]
MTRDQTEPLIETREFRIGGLVQGVGFRPFVKRLAESHRIVGWVKNEASYVSVLATGRPDQLDLFAMGLVSDAPPFSRPIVEFDIKRPTAVLTAFSIVESESGSTRQADIPLDCYLCDDCLGEINDPSERRYRYPFTNCTQCGPRYTIIRALPYDRINTTMAQFALCPDCRREYDDPDDRRFHAQPLACPNCGPQLRFDSGSSGEILGNEQALSACITALRQGLTVAVRGIGGYHLMCDATDEAAVLRLRSMKQRPDKPLAVMLPAKEIDPTFFAREIAYLDAPEETALRDPVRPIVLLRRRSQAPIAQAVAPGLREIGLMLPYSPLHHLITTDFGKPLVATSGNISGEPVITGEDEAELRLKRCCDAFLHHNRPIHRPADDPVVRIIADRARPIRLGRGSAPLACPNPYPLEAPVLACGAQLKTTVALGIDNRVIVSPHVGDMGTLRSKTVFEQVAHDFQSLYGVSAAFVVHDAHPDFTTTRWASRQASPHFAIEHHTAHAAALAAEHRCTEAMVVFAWDGLGLGPDATLWGGETFFGSPGRWRRIGTFRPFRLIGGDRVALEPWRSACALSWEVGHPWQSRRPDAANFQRAWNAGAGTESSAVGRLFDAAAALVGLTESCSYDGQAPAMVESASDPITCSVALPVRQSGDLRQVDWAPLVPMLLDASLSIGERLAIFHGALSATLLAEALHHRGTIGTNIVGLTGGVFQNRLLTEHAVSSLEEHGFDVRLHERLPMNDGGVSFGQVIEFAARRTLK